MTKPAVTTALSAITPPATVGIDEVFTAESDGAGTLYLRGEQYHAQPARGRRHGEREQRQRRRHRHRHQFHHAIGGRESISVAGQGNTIAGITSDTQLTA